MSYPKSIHHSFDIGLASTYGLQAAVIIHHFQYWISFNASLNRNFHEGRHWSYQTLDELAAHFPYWSRSEIVNILELLCRGKGRRSKKEGLDFEPVLMKGNFNRAKYDHTTWYAFVDEPKWILAQAKIDIGSHLNTQDFGSSQNRNCSKPKPIPDTKTDTKTLNIDGPPDLLIFGPFVKISKKEYDELVSKHGEELIKQKIEEINDHLSSHGKKPYKDYAAAIRNFIRRSATSTHPFRATMPQKRTEMALEFAKRVKDKFPYHQDIRLEKNGLEFVLSPSQGSKVILYTENGFDEQVLNQLRKWNLPTDGL